MRVFKSLTVLFFVSIFLIGRLLFPLSAFGAFDVQGVELFRDGNLCITMAGSTTPESFNLANLQSNQESVQTKISSSGSLCQAPFFTGGALLTTSPKTIQANPTVQGVGTGILISEDVPSGFNGLISRLGNNIASIIFEVSLPTGCDVIDDDNDIVGASTDLSNINDFSFPACTSTNGFTLECSSASGLLTAANGLVAATSSSPAKIRFVISNVNGTADGNMVDSFLLKLDSQDIFCPHDIASPLTATIIGKNAVDSPTKEETIGQVNLGTLTPALKASYATETSTSLRGEVSTNIVSTTPTLVGATSTTLNTIEIEELHNESIPIGGRSSPSLINPSLTSTVEITSINLYLIPSVSTLFSSVPSSSDIIFSDGSIILSSTPYIVKTNADDTNAPIGTLVIPIKKNPDSTDPANVKTKITIKNLVLSQFSSTSQDFTVSVLIYELISGAIVNTPGAISINNSTNPNNPQNFSSFSPTSTRALAQNAVVGGAANESTGAAQILNDTDLLALTNRNTTLGSPRITKIVNVVSSVTAIDVDKINVEMPGQTSLTINGSAGASIGGAKIKIDSLPTGSMAAFDSVTITSKGDGSFSAKLQADFSSGDVTLNFKQTVNGIDSAVLSKTVETPESDVSTLACDKTICGCENPSCTPTVVIVINYVKDNGGLAEVISKGGAILEEVIKSVKKALGLS